MSRDRKPSVSKISSETDIFQPQASLRKSALWKDGKPDPRLVKLVHLLARVTVIEHFEAECAAQKELEDKQKVITESDP